MMTTHAPLTPSPESAGCFAAPPIAADPRHFLGLEGLSRERLTEWLDAAAREREVLRSGAPDRTDLTGCVVMLGFIEDSTRTRTSFDIAARRLGAHTISFSASASSLNKGESVLDTMRLFEAMGAQVLVVRHFVSGAAAHLAARLPGMAVINAGDGTHEHPTQGLLDLLTLRDRWDGRFEGRRLVIVGDIAHSRVARSAIAGLTTLGATVTVCGPETLMPAEVEALGCTRAHSLDDALERADGVMALRIQRERMEKGLLPALGEYASRFGITPSRVARMKPGAPVMHPGPVMRGVELPCEVADGPASVVLDQVANGVAVRCAVLRHAWTQWQAARR